MLIICSPALSDEGLTNPWLAGNHSSWGNIMNPRLVTINLKVIEYPYVISANPNLWEREIFDADIEHVAARNDIVVQVC